MEVTGKLDLRLDLILLTEHAVSETDANLEGATIISFIFVDVIGPDDAAVQPLVVVLQVIELELESVDLLLQVLLVVVNDGLVQNVEHNLKSLISNKMVSG